MKNKRIIRRLVFCAVASIAVLTGLALLPSREHAAVESLTLVVKASNALSGLDRSNPNITEAVESTAPHIVTWRGGLRDRKWSNPENWIGGQAPRAGDVARFAAKSKLDVIVDSQAGETIAGLELQPGYRGTLSLERDLNITGDVSIAAGTINQANHRLRARSYHQTGGKLSGGAAPLLIEDEGTVTGGILTTPALMKAQSLRIESPGVVRLSANAKLELSGSGDPLRGSGLLDVTSNRPNSVEYTGAANQDLTAARPARQLQGRRHVAPDEQESEGDRSSTTQSKTPLSPDTFGRLGSIPLLAGDSYFECAVIDPAAGFAYFGGATFPGRIVKIRLSDFTKVGTLTLNSGEDFLGAATIDPVGGFAYFGTVTAPGRIVKVRLSDFTRVASVTFNSGENFPRVALIDPVAGFGYFAGNTAPGNVVKVRLSDMTRVGGLTLNGGENFLRSGVIDTVAGFAYFATNTGPGRVVKVQLSDLTRVGAVTANSGENNFRSAAIDTGAGFAYFGTSSGVVKVKLSDLTRVGALSLSDLSTAGYRSALIDTAGGFVYFSSYSSPSIVAKIRLSDFTRVSTLTLNGAESFVFGSAIDPAGGFAYLGTDTSVGRIIKVRLSDFSRNAALTLSAGEDQLNSAVIDTAGGFAYFGTYSEPAMIVKIRLSDFTKVGTLTLNPGESYFFAAVIDPAGGFAYFGTDASPGRVVKIRLSDFTRVGALTLNAGEDFLESAMIDTVAGFAYFNNGFTNPSSMVKIRLSDFTRVGALVLDGNDGAITSAVIDQAAGFAYLGMGLITDRGRVVKVRLSDFTRVGALILNQNEDFLFTAVIDPAAGFAYFANQSSPSFVVKVRLSDFTRVGALNFNAGEDFLWASIIDPAGGFAYFTTLTAPGFVVKVRLSDFTRVGALTFTGDEAVMSSAVIDPAAGLAYFGSGNAPGTVVKVDISAGAGPKTLQFGASSYEVTEDNTSIAITVNRIGDVSSEASVDYATSDGTASERRDYITTTGKLRFAAGETSKTFNVPINEDSYVEGTETFNVTLSNPAGVNLSAPPTATIYINDDFTEPLTNVIDDSQNFVGQQYHDFLNRQADAPGLAFWTNGITSCGANQACIDVARVNTSAAFFFSIEFQQTGYLVEKMYKVAFGNSSGTSTLGGAHAISVPIVRLNEFIPDTQRIGAGVVVGQAGWEAVLEANKQAFASEFVQRSRFTTAFATTLTPAEFVDALNINAGLVLSAGERTTAINLFAGAGNTTNVTARAQALRQIAEDADLSAAEFNRAFVLMQFFGYLRRDPNSAPDTDYTGYDFWLTKLNQFNGSYIDAEMVKAFLGSIEYRQRFGP